MEERVSVCVCAFGMLLKVHPNRNYPIKTIQNHSFHSYNEWSLQGQNRFSRWIFQPVCACVFFIFALESFLMDNKTIVVEVAATNDVTNE